MTQLFKNFAPAHRVLACAGVFVICIGLAIGCEKGGRRQDGSDRTLELSGDTIDVPRGVTLHDVQVQAARNTEFNPVQISAKSADIVRFTVHDRSTHGLVITAPTEPGNAALDASAQRRSPPLVSEGQSWVVSLKGLPAGTYRVSCIAHAGTATLVIQ